MIHCGIFSIKLFAELGQSCTAKYNSSVGHFKICEDGLVCNSTTNICEISPTVPDTDDLDDNSDDYDTSITS
jgi:hypothetical protein